MSVEDPRHPDDLYLGTVAGLLWWLRARLGVGGRRGRGLCVAGGRVGDVQQLPRAVGVEGGQAGAAAGGAVGVDGDGVGGWVGGEQDCADVAVGGDR
ncbi:hypothetical protein AB0B66_38430 [Catellatospora sp. NPDC049111]|uniref:hypothetical protein n=1 Tax=Catellatospora sp. NPDC049111 TaxID=3155271 RepID=UPI0033FB7FD7